MNQALESGLAGALLATVAERVPALAPLKDQNPSLYGALIAAGAAAVMAMLRDTPTPPPAPVDPAFRPPGWLV